MKKTLVTALAVALRGEMTLGAVASSASSPHEQIWPAIAVEVHDPAPLLERGIDAGRCDISLLGVDR